MHAILRELLYQEDEDLKLFGLNEVYTDPYARYDRCLKNFERIIKKCVKEKINLDAVNTDSIDMERYSIF